MHIVINQIDRCNNLFVHIYDFRNYNIFIGKYCNKITINLLKYIVYGRKINIRYPYIHKSCIKINHLIYNMTDDIFSCTYPFL